MSAQYIVSLQAHITDLKCIINQQQLQLQHSTLEWYLAQKDVQTHRTEAFAILSRKILSQLHYRNLPPSMQYLSEGMEWSDFGEILLNLPYGYLQQPQPNFRPHSKRIIRVLTTRLELQSLFSFECLKKTFYGGSYALLDVPLFLIWSKTRKRLSVRFSYTAFNFLGKFLQSINN